MTTKITISLPDDQVVAIRRAVEEGRASSVSGFISEAVARSQREDSLLALLDDLDRDIPPAGRLALARALARLAAAGPAIVVAAGDRGAVPGADPIVELLPPAGRPAWTFDPAVPTEA